MAIASDRAWRWGLAAVSVLVGVIFVREVILSQAPHDGPVPVVLDRDACARCRMLVSERAFAAQAHTHAGQVHHFDDPGCLLLWSQEHADEVSAAYVHHVEDDRWIEASRSVFVPADPTPMGYGLGARERGEAPGISWIEAQAEVLQGEKERRSASREGASARRR